MDSCQFGSWTFSNKPLGVKSLAWTALLSLTALGLASADDTPSDTDRPVQQELDKMSEGFKKKAPPELIKLFSQGIEAVRKQGLEKNALKVGDKAVLFTLPNASKDQVALEKLLAKGPVVLTWYRGGWCPYCNVALRGFIKENDRINKLGATLVAITPELPSKALSTKEKNNLPFQVLSDKGNKVAKQYKIVFTLPDDVAKVYKQRIDLEKYNGDDSYQLPAAATYVIDTNGVIRYAFVDADYKKRAEPSDVVKALEKVVSTKN